ncbi:MAG: hypothetical protein IPM08_12635 [Actinomycetales bacterium]|nr:hypothetical protein [Actinomycetales bacterium]
MSVGVPGDMPPSVDHPAYPPPATAYSPPVTPRRGPERLSRPRARLLDAE